MSISTCPIATINAPLELVWAYISEPANYALWWDARTESIVPAGHAAPGQVIEATTVGLGRRWKVRVVVEGVDDARHQLDLTTSLPLGITGHNHLTCTPLDEASVRLSFG